MTIADALDKNYARLERQLIQVAEDMPADKYSFRPTPQVRNFGEQLRHIGAVQWVVGAGLLDENPPVDVGEGSVKGTLDNSNIIPPATPEAIEACGVPLNNIASLAFAMRTGKVYANVHSTAFPAGVSRGQLLPDDDDNGDNGNNSGPQ